MHSIACKIDPFQKVRDFVSANAQSNFQHFRAADFLAQRGIEARAALLDHSEVKSCDVGDRLNMIVALKVGVRRAVEIAVVSRNRG